MALRPLHNRIIVERSTEGEQKQGSIIIPDSAKEKPQQATVTAVGPGRVNDEGKRLTLDVKVGDVVLIGKYAGSEVSVDGSDYVILTEDEVLAVVG